MNRKINDIYNNEKSILDYKVELKGQNLSVGQRQLIAFIRGILRNTKIIIMDEMTSNIDFERDEIIQNIFKETIKFQNKTIITIAHRLKTIINYDMIIVMDNGNIIEYGNPLSLLKDIKSEFYELCANSKDFNEIISILN